MCLSWDRMNLCSINVIVLILALASEAITYEKALQSKRPRGECDGYWPKSWMCENTTIGVWTRWMWCDWLEPPQIYSFSEWHKASSTGRCAQPESCTLTFKIESKREVKNLFQVALEVSGAIQEVVSLGIGLEQEQTVTDTATREQEFTCRVRPGYEADVWLGAEMKSIRGTMKTLQKEWDGIFYRPGSHLCYDVQGEIIMPVRDGNNGQLSGPLECHQRPIANIDHVSFLISKKTMNEYCDLDAANAVMDKILERVPPMGLSYLVKLRHCEVGSIWARTACFNKDDVHMYQAICRGCLQYLRDNILSKSKNSYGADWKVTDCSLRFDFFYFD